MHSFITMKHDLVPPDNLVYKKNAVLFQAICQIVFVIFGASD